MPPRKPVATPRSPALKAGAAMARAAASPLPAKAAKPMAISPYPDLAMAIAMLQRRAGHVGGERKMLLDKWILTLSRLQGEMTRLRKLEKLADNLSQPHQGDLPL